MNKLLFILSKTELIPSLNLKEWDDILRLARQARLFGHLHFLIEKNNFLDQVPVQVKNMLEGGAIYNSFFRLQARRELRQLTKVVSKTSFQVILLKGAAYIDAEVGAFAGRRLSDVDLLVSKKDLHAVEQLLIEEGWQHGKVDDYDQHYYRDWMHEIPPLIHKNRNMEIDLHHNIMPPIGHIKIDAEKILSSSQRIKNSAFHILEPKDLFLHSACHLFLNDELRGGLRDLVDMHELSLQYSKHNNFWTEIVSRSRDLGLQRGLYYALTTLDDFFKTPIPKFVLKDIQLDKPNILVDILMKILIQKVLAPKDVENMNSNFSEWILFIRSHWIKMPVYILIPHLIKKAWKGLIKNKE